MAASPKGGAGLRGVRLPPATPAAGPVRLGGGSHHASHNRPRGMLSKKSGTPRQSGRSNYDREDTK